MKTRMKKTLTKPLRSLAKGMFVVALLGLVMKDAAARNMYNCRQEAREMKGLHNMVLFGQPEGDLYAYHLPLFSGEVNGEGGHVQMHVYQGIWRVTLDQETLKSYRSKFAKEKSPSLPFPFFSFSPREKKFKVPELICEREFEMKAVAAYGHVESNPEFPKPEVLKQGLSTIKKSRTVFAQRFHGASIDELTYILFGTKNQYYMAHYLTDDENSFDQIVAVNVKDSILESRVRREGGVLVKVPLAKNPHLIRVFNDPRIKQNNNLYRLPVPVKTPGEVPGESVSIEVGGRDSVIEVEARIYFNANSDLHRF